MAIEYGANNAILLTWELLPGSESHPGGSAPYCYFLTYNCVTHQGMGHGSMTYIQDTPIQTLSDIRRVEEWGRSEIHALELHLISCKAMKEPTPELLHDYEQALRANNPD